MIKAPRTNKLERKEKKGKEREGKGMRGEGKGGRNRTDGKGREGKERNRNYAKRGNLGVPSRPSIHAGLPLIRRLWLN